MSTEETLNQHHSPFTPLLSAVSHLLSLFVFYSLRMGDFSI